MKVSELIQELQGVIETHGDIAVQFQNLQEQDVTFPLLDGGTATVNVMNESAVFAVPETYADGATVCNLRSWPY